jgi:drug/metabolite transporter (DMT)-like permease
MLPWLRSEKQGTLLVLISAAGFATLAILAMMAYRAGIPPLVALNWRFLLAALLMAGYVRANRLPWRVPRREAAVLLLLGGLGYAAMSALFFAALQFIAASATSLLLYTYPAFVSLFSFVLWRTPLGRRHFWALSATGAGTFLLLWSPGLQLNPTGTLLGLGAAVVYSFYLLANQHLVHGVEAGIASGYIIVGAAVTFTALTTATGAFTAVFSPLGWLALGLMAFCSTALPIVTLLAGIRRLGAARASILSTFEPVLTVLLALLLLGERLSPWQAAGGAFIAGGMLLLHLPAPLRRPGVEPPAAASGS